MANCSVADRGAERIAPAQLVAAHTRDGSALVLLARDASGQALAVELDGVRPYLWARLDGGRGAYDEAAALERLAAAAAAGDERRERTVTGEVRRFRRFHGYEPADHPFARVVLASARAARGAREALLGWELAEADADFAAQALADLGVEPGTWFELTGEAARADVGCAPGIVSFRAPARAVRARPDVGGLAPLRVLSFDIETLTKDLGNGAVKFFDGGDPDARLVCAACADVELGGGAAAERRVVFALDPDGGAQRVEQAEGEALEIRWFADEADALLALAAHVRDRDCDFLTGWNTDGFDLQWLGEAAVRLGVEHDFWRLLSRFRREPARHREAARGVKVRLSAPGRVPYDLLQWFKKNRQLESYTLEFVAQTYGCGGKQDVEYAQIGELFRSPEGRRRLALYCAQDAALVLRLIAAKELDPLGKDLALCAITGALPADLLGRGTQHTLKSKIMRVARARGFVIPYVPRAQASAPEAEDEREVGFRGGMVLTAAAGRYVDPVAVFDFASLYPSCMEQHNTCASSRLTRASAQALGVNVTTPPAPSLEGVWLRTDGTRTMIQARPSRGGGDRYHHPWGLPGGMRPPPDPRPHRAARGSTGLLRAGAFMCPSGCEASGGKPPHPRRAPRAARRG